MRPITKLVTLGVLTAAVAAPTALGATLTATATVTGKGTDLYAAPATVEVNGTFTKTPTTDGAQQLKSITASLPQQILFNQNKFTQCSIPTFISSGVCPSKSKVGTAEIVADGSTAVGDINAKVDMYYGQGFTILSRVVVTEKAPIDEKIVGYLRSSGKAGYGMQIYIPTSPLIRQPLGPGSILYPTVKTMKATIAPPTRNSSVYDKKGKKVKIKVPLAGLEKCGSLPFDFTVNYSNAAEGTAETYNANGQPNPSSNFETAQGNAKCTTKK
jgi:hypothetical protein